MVAHYRVGQPIYGADSGQIDKAFFDPLPAMIEVLAAVAIITAKKRTPNAARCAMVIRCMVETDLLAACNRHVDAVFDFRVTITTHRDLAGTRAIYSVSLDSVELMSRFSRLHPQLNPRFLMTDRSLHNV